MNEGGAKDDPSRTSQGGEKGGQGAGGDWQKDRERAPEADPMGERDPGKERWSDEEKR